MIPASSSIRPQNLPAEVLCAIFAYLVPIYPINKGRPTLGWAFVTHVCGHWRSIAIEHSALWTTLHTDYFAAWDVFRQRANGLPLTIVDSDGFHRINEDELVRVLLPILSSAKSVTLRSSDYMTPDFLEHLEKCELINDLTVCSFYPGINSTSLPRLSTSLRSLRTHDILFPWTFQARDLRHLELTMHREILTEWGVPYESKFVDVLATLDSMRSLEQLVLSYVIPSAWTLTDATKRRIALPRLRGLTLRDHSRSCATLWSLLDFPADASVLIDFRSAFLGSDQEMLLVTESLMARFSSARGIIPIYPRVRVEKTQEPWQLNPLSGTLLFDMGHEEDCISATGAGHAGVSPSGKPVICLRMPIYVGIYGIHDAQLDWREFLAITRKLLEAIPTDMFEVLTVVVSDHTKVKREGVFQHATVEERPIIVEDSSALYFIEDQDSTT
ncbi:hypothetical protein PENSPDRAFT_647758 [Peniophora sp. CONT]|nr:hypothetical protein PENSPDRAFT_647758 [Peniophora sp. CONT]